MLKDLVDLDLQKFDEMENEAKKWIDLTEQYGANACAETLQDRKARLWAIIETPSQKDTQRINSGSMDEMIISKGL